MVTTEDFLPLSDAVKGLTEPVAEQIGKLSPSEKEDPIKTELRIIKYILVIIAFILSVIAISCIGFMAISCKSKKPEPVKKYKSITLENVLIDSTSLTREDSVSWFGQKGYDLILKFK
jgi:hypothetical protein